MNTVIKAPVLLLAFNRPAKTREVFECIRRAKPQKLYVAVDAPREGRQDDVDNCNQVKAIVKNVDWPCETHYLFHEKNQGCTMAGKKAWDWLFSQEEEMIFMEDDGVVTDSFFVYCQELLEKYRDDERIAYIGGVNFGQKYGEASYFFTRYSVSTYGMATWKRVYDLYDYDLDTYPATRNTKDFRSQFLSRFEQAVFLDMFDEYRKSVDRGQRINTYDRQMNYLVCKYHKWCIYPNLNQVTNIGFDSDASNTVVVDPDSEYARAHVRPRYEISEIVHPKEVCIDPTLERVLFRVRLLGGHPIWKAQISMFIERIKRPLRRCLKG